MPPHVIIQRSIHRLCTVLPPPTPVTLSSFASLIAILVSGAADRIWFSTA
jgi:hypothetical protein